MSNTSDLHASLPHKDVSRKPGPKGGVLEPYAGNILHMAREGQSMQRIVNWLAEPPRNVSISRQGVHSWVNARIRKLKKLRDAFMDTGLEGLFQTNNAAAMAHSMRLVSGPDPPRLVPQAVDGSFSATSKPEVKRISTAKFMVDTKELNRINNPFEQ